MESYNLIHFISYEINNTRIKVDEVVPSQKNKNKISPQSLHHNIHNTYVGYYSTLQVKITFLLLIPIQA